MTEDVARGSEATGVLRPAAVVAECYRSASPNPLAVLPEPRAATAAHAPATAAGGSSAGRVVLALVLLLLVFSIGPALVYALQEVRRRPAPPPPPPPLELQRVEVMVPLGHTLVVAALVPEYELELRDADHGDWLPVERGTDGERAQMRYVGAVDPAQRVVVVLPGGRPPALVRLEPPPGGLVVFDPQQPGPEESEEPALGPGLHALHIPGVAEYRIDVPGASELEVTVTFEPSEGDLDVELTTEDGLPLDRSVGQGDTEVVRCRTDVATSVRLRLYNASLTCDVDVRVTELGPLSGVGLGPGDGPGVHTDLSLADGEAIHRYLVGAGQELSIVLTYDRTRNDIDMQLLDEWDGELAASAGVTGREEIRWVAPRDCEVRLRVHNGHDRYSLNVRVGRAR